MPSAILKIQLVLTWNILDFNNVKNFGSPPPLSLSLSLSLNCSFTLGKSNGILTPTVIACKFIISSERAVTDVVRTCGPTHSLVIHVCMNQQ